MNSLNELKCNPVDKMDINKQLTYLLKLQQTYSYIYDTVSSKTCKDLYKRKLEKNDRKIELLMKEILSKSTLKLEKK